MNKIVTSRHNRSSSELFLMVPIKPGFVPISDVVLTYASRVSAVLNTLFELRQQKLERGHGEQIGPIERMETISRVQWTVLRSFDELREAVPEVRSDLWTQIRGPQLILTSHFDRSWEDYFHALVDLGKPLLDLIFSHCEGYENHSCERGYEAFSEWIRRHQWPVNFLFAAAPEVTVTDQRYFRELMTHLTKLPAPTGAASTRQLMTHLATFKILRKDEDSEQILKKAGQAPLPSSKERFQSVVSAVNALYDIGSRLFSGDVELEGRTGTKLYEAAVHSVLEKEPDVILLRRELDALRKQANAAPAGSVTQPAAQGSKPPMPKALVWIEKVLREGDSAASPPSPAATTNQPSCSANASRDRATIAAETASLVGNNIQFNILERHVESECGSLLLLHCEKRESLQALFDGLKDVRGLWQGLAPQSDGKVFLNFALTYAGLERARLGEDVMRHFPREFREGMEDRAGVLGDVGPYNHPRFWKTPLSLNGGDERIDLATVDAVVILHAASTEDIARFTARYRQGLRDAGIHVLHCSELSRTAAEGFGFRDQISQPIPDPKAPEPDAPEPGAPYSDRTALGEFLLGYHDRNRRIAPCADPNQNQNSAELFKDSTFMVMRKMRQDIDAFDSYVQDACNRLNAQRATGVVPPGLSPIEPHDIHAAIVGRRRDGGLRNTPKVLTTAPAPNNFDFSNDTRGAVCPFHSHVRLANPRLPGTPRILRRGFSYGPDSLENGEKGSLFIAYNASIAEQYEILQRYINGSNPTGISSFQNDPLCGAASFTAAPRWMSMSGKGKDDFVSLPERPEDKPFVTLCWGLYLFVPSLKAVEWLAKELTKEPATESESVSVARGAHRIRDLDALPADLAKLEWKRVLEEVPEAGTAQAREADEIWAAVRSTGGVKKVDAELIVVGSEECARRVLGDDGSTFSVRVYKERLEHTIRDHYLAHDVNSPGMPHGPTYADLSDIPNRELAGVTSDAYQRALDACKKVLQDPDDLQQTINNSKRSVISVRDLARAVVGVLCEQWFGMPRTPNTVGTYTSLIDSLERFLLTSRYAFQFAPGDRLKQEALEQGGTITSSYPETLKGLFLDALDAAYYAASFSSGGTQILRQTVIGAVVGFAPPTVGAVTRVLDQWIENGDFWRIRTDATDPNKTDAVQRDVLKIAVLAALGQTPSPPILYRTAVKSVRLGSVDVQSGTTVVVALRSVYVDASARGSALPEAWLFGGQHGGAALTPGKTPHGCPVRDAGTAVIAGIAAGLFARKNVKRERRFVVSYDSV